MQNDFELVDSGEYGSGCSRVVWKLYRDHTIIAEGPDVETGCVYAIAIEDREGKTLQKMGRIYESVSQGWVFLSSDDRPFLLGATPRHSASTRAMRLHYERKRSHKFCTYEEEFGGCRNSRCLKRHG